MRWHRSMATAGLLFVTTASRGQDPQGADSVRALGKLQDSPENKTSVPPELRALIINKPEIAEQTLQRVVGLREAGNPHIQRGDGLLLPEIKDNPELSRVDTAKLREERIAMYERRPEKQPPHHADAMGSAGPAGAQSGAERGPGMGPTGAAATEGAGYAGLFLAGALLCLGVGTGLYFWQRSRKT